MNETEKLDKIAEELFPDLRLEFSKRANQKPDISIGYINIESVVCIKDSEISERILKGRVKNALLNLKDLIQNDLDKLEKL